MLNGDVPFAFLGLPLGLLYFLAGTEILVDIVFTCNTLPVVSNFTSLGEFLRPLSIRSNPRLVDMCRDIAANTGIGILEPANLLGLHYGTN
jgi:hypothetical protein